MASIIASGKRAAVLIVQKRKYENPWGIECCEELRANLKVNLFDLNSLQSSIFLAQENPSHLD